MLRLACVVGLCGMLLACAAGEVDAEADVAQQAHGTADPANDGTPAIGGGRATHGGGTPGFVPAPHPPMPQMVSLGGPVMRAPRVVPIFFPGDPLQSEITSFLYVVGTTDYWAANTSEYGVGPLTAASAVVLDDVLPATTSSQAMQDILANAIESGKLPPADGETLYLLFPPQTTTIITGADKSCATFGGYHYEARTRDGKSIIYGLVPRCANFNGLTGLDMVTVAASHELIEAATDPLVASAPAFRQPDPDHAMWGIVFTSEAGDLCAQNPNAAATLPGLSYRVQKSWSNAAARDSHDPCALGPGGGIYFNSAAVLEDSIVVLDGDRSVVTKGLKLAIGETKTIDLALYSDGPTEAWKVTPIDLRGLRSGKPLLEFTQSATRGKNGDRIQLSITLRGIDPALGAAPFLVSSTLDGQTSYWVGAVGN